MTFSYFEVFNFMTTISTTVGYGSFTPTTMEGKNSVIVCGIVLVLICSGKKHNIYTSA